MWLEKTLPTLYNEVTKEIIYYGKDNTGIKGRQVIKPDELEDMDTEESTVMENRNFAESIQASRDNIKIQKKSSVYGVQFVLLGLESQESIHYAMPMRVMVTVQVGLHILLCRPYKRIKQEGNGAIYMRSLPHSVTVQPPAEQLRLKENKQNSYKILRKEDYE